MRVTLFLLGFLVYFGGVVASMAGIGLTPLTPDLFLSLVGFASMWAGLTMINAAFANRGAR